VVSVTIVSCFVLPELVSLQRSLGIQSSRAPMASVTREAGIALCGHETDPTCRSRIAAETPTDSL